MYFVPPLVSGTGLIARWDANLEASLPQLQLLKVSNAKEMQDHPTPLRGHLGPLERSLWVSAASDVIPAILLDSFKMAGQRGNVTVTSNAAAFPLSHTAKSTSAIVVISGETRSHLLNDVHGLQHGWAVSS